MPRLLYVEDDAEIAEMTIEVMSEAYRVEHITDGREAVRRALDERYDLMVIDRRLPHVDGVAIVRAVRTAHITTPILILTALGSVADRVDGLDAGANDYLVKPFEFDELLARIRALLRGFQSGLKRREIGEWTYLPEASAVYTPSAARVTLTETENRLLRLLAESPDHVFSRAQIMAMVFPTSTDVGSIDTYVHYIRRKTAPDMIETVRGRGYRVGSPS